MRGLGESFEPQEFSGAGSYSIPIPAPEARGFEPDLEIEYSSGGGNGIFGMGFSLGLPNISRKTHTGVPAYDGSDIFILAGQGELTPALVWNEDEKEWLPVTRQEPSGSPLWEVVTYRPRHEGGHLEIERWTGLTTGESHWQVITGDNGRHVYGKTKEARIFDPDHPTRIYQWLIEESRDALGNRIRYRYAPDPDAPQTAQEGSAESGHDLRSNRYPSEIEYGNYFASGEERFAFRICFGYGQYSLEHPEAPPGAWKVRPDPFSSYRSGFEIRTQRRCENVLIFHYFHDQFGGKPFLTRALALRYRPAGSLAPEGQPASDLSFLARIFLLGIRQRQGGGYLPPALTPPLDFGWAGFDPGAQAFSRLEVEGGGALPGRLSKGQYLPVDLEGEGLPGMLYSDGEAALYWPPEGGGRYGGPQVPETLPLERDLEEPAFSLLSLEGGGAPDLVVRIPGRSGFYRSRGAGTWQPFEPFAPAPTELGDGEAQLVDLNGSGRPDLVAFEEGRIVRYPSLGLAGFGTPQEAPLADGFPLTRRGSKEEVIAFADLFGDGLSHRVRVRDGLVECWPCLGHGRFGPKLTLENAPRFGHALDARRLFLVDLDGSGTADLIYLSGDHLTVWLNQSGNGFSDPWTLPLPAPWDELTQVSFADLHGNGTSCLVLTRLAPQVEHHVFDFAGDAKPYLLTAVDNHAGALTQITYTTSAKQALADRQSGRPWATKLFFPVQVVARVDHIDQISRSRQTQLFAHHDGYYDPHEREFRGFGYVESWDSEDFETSSEAAADPALPVDPVAESRFAPPMYSRTWFLTGASLEAESIAAGYRAEYWQGDPEASSLPGSHLQSKIRDHSAETIRQAYEAMAGQRLRQEIYGLDGSAAASVPYTVSETSTAVRLLQPLQRNRYAVFLAHHRESLVYHYERDASDPRVLQEVSLEVDDFGNVKRRCSVAYPRREVQGVAVYPEQQIARVTATESRFIDHPRTAGEPYRWIGVAWQQQQFELRGLTLSHGCLSFAEVKSQAGKALKSPLAYDQPFTPGETQARLFSWQRSYFWDEDQLQALSHGRISAQGLLHHQETAVLTPDLARDAWQGRVTSDALQAAGYHSAEGYWWNRGLIRYYSKEAEEFFLPRQTDGLFPGVDPTGPLDPTTTTEYDSYRLLPTTVTRYLEGVPPARGDGEPPPAETSPVTLAVKVANDYQAMSPWRLTDANETVSEVLFDPLSQVVVSTTYGVEAGSPAGDEPLTSYTSEPEASLEEILAARPRFLQGATTFFFRDRLAWFRRRQPNAELSLLRQKHVHQLEPHQTSPIQTAIRYYDGFGRVVESKLETDPGPLLPEADEPIFVEERWIVSGRTVYDNKGNPVEQFLPYFSPTPEYEDPREAVEADLVPPPTVFHYDALDRLIRTDTPKGFFTKTGLSAWEIEHYDEDDTVLDSAFYKSFPKQPTTPAEKNERDALDKAAVFYGTPSVVILDAVGATARSQVNNLGAVAPAAFDEIVQGTQTTAQELWDRLVADGYLKKDEHDPKVARVTRKLRPYDGTFQQTFRRQLAELAAPVLDLLKESQLTTLHVRDIEGREIRSVDPRLLYTNVTKDTTYQSFAFVYDMLGNALATDSADAGNRWSLVDIFGRLVDAWDERTFHTSRQYDRLGRLVQVQVAGGDGQEGVSKFSQPVTTQVLVYGEGHPDADAYNLKGEVYRLYDQAGLLTFPSYSIGGQVMEEIRQIRADYEVEANWTQKAQQKVATQESFPSRSVFDALGRILEETSPDGSSTTPTYNAAGLLSRVEAALVDGDAAATFTTIVDQIDYNAQSQRVRVLYGNGVATAYGYEPTTQRLLSIQSRRPQISQLRRRRPRSREAPRMGSDTLQAIAYTYDPVGNVTRTVDTSWEPIFSGNQKVDPLSDYTYDALYRLVRATGRQQVAAAGGPTARERRFMEGKRIPFSRPAPQDPLALENYIQTYRYDDGGNLTRTRHQASRSWTRELEIAPGSNRQAGVGYDADGNTRKLRHLQRLAWSYRNSLVQAEVISRQDAANDSELYLYDSTGNRVLKVTQRAGNLSSGSSTTETELKIYLGSYEIKRVQQGAGGDPETLLERRSLSLMDDHRRVCLTHYWPVDERSREVRKAGRRSFRYQLEDRLQSVALEVDGQGKRLTYEEYLPYGGLALIAGSSALEVRLKEYRYSAKERDSATGLYYYGARYYPPWLGRWMNPDPAGTIDGLNLFAFVGGNPITHVDIGGMGKGAGAGKKAKPPPKKKAKKASTIRVHGMDIAKPPTHPMMHARGRALGVTVGMQLRQSKADERAWLKQLQTKLTDIMIAHGLQLQKEATLKRAVEAGLQGDQDTFSRLYREASDHMDEHLSTVTVFTLLEGIGKSGAALNEAQMETIQLTVSIVSSFRMPTSETGFSTSHGSVQHPTSEDLEMFAARGHAHNHWDRDRRDEALKEAEITKLTGIHLLLDMSLVASVHSLSWGIAPARAKNNRTLSGVDQATINQQMAHREAIKKMIRVLKGPSYTAAGHQEEDAQWNPTRTRARSPSPERRRMVA